VFEDEADKSLCDRVRGVANVVHGRFFFCVCVDIVIIIILFILNFKISCGGGGGGVSNPRMCVQHNIVCVNVCVCVCVCVCVWVYVHVQCFSVYNSMKEDSTISAYADRCLSLQWGPEVCDEVAICSQLCVAWDGVTWPRHCCTMKF